MTGECTDLLLVVGGTALMVGLLIGKWVEAWAWRVTAADFRERKSAGKTYVVLTGTKF